MDKMDKYYGILLSIYIYVHYPTFHPILLYNGQDGQYYGIQVSSHIYLILLSILSYCTMDKMDSTMESKYTVIFTLSYCPSRPIVPWIGWTVLWNPSIHSGYLILLSILSYCTMDKMDSTMESKYPLARTRQNSVDVHTINSIMKRKQVQYFVW